MNQTTQEHGTMDAFRFTLNDSSWGTKWHVVTTIESDQEMKRTDITGLIDLRDRYLSNDNHMSSARL